jgi:hypothetical protein
MSGSPVPLRIRFTYKTTKQSGDVNEATVTARVLDVTAGIITAVCEDSGVVFQIGVPKPHQTGVALSAWTRTGQIEAAGGESGWQAWSDA